MLRQTKTTLRTLVTTLSLLGPGIALAQVDTSDWLCESCPFDKGYRATIDVGAINSGLLILSRTRLAESGWVF